MPLPYAIPFRLFRLLLASLKLESLIVAADSHSVTPVINVTGGRGQKAKEFLEENGFTNMVNGGGPKDSENWAIF